MNKGWTDVKRTEVERTKTQWPQHYKVPSNSTTMVGVPLQLTTLQFTTLQQWRAAMLVSLQQWRAMTL